MTDPNSLESVMAQLAGKADETPLTGRQRRARTIARLAAVQALYQVGSPGTELEFAL